jgi:D-threo-aldose 1-dehydrogenase
MIDQSVVKTITFNAPFGGQVDLTEMGFGTAPLGNLYRELSNQQAEETLQAAWDGGIRYFDTAPMYGFGLSECRVGEFLVGKDRSSFVLSTKIGRLLEPASPAGFDAGQWVNPHINNIVYDYSYGGVMRSFEASLKRLNLDRVDILYIHDVDAFTHGSREASDRRIKEVMDGGYKALEELRGSGVVQAIGAGVNEWEVCETLTRLGEFDIFLLAGRYTLLEQDALNSFLPICENSDIGIVLGGPYNSGILATGPIKGAKYNYVDAPPKILDRVSRIEAVCSDHNVPLVQAALQFPTAHPSVITVIPGGQTPQEVQQNLSIYSEKIPAGLWSDLKSAGLIRNDAPVPSGE